MAKWTEVSTTLVETAQRVGSWREQAACWLLAESGVFSSHWPDRLQAAGFIAWEDQEEEDWDLARVRWEVLSERLRFDNEYREDQLYGTGAEWCMIRFACSLVNGRGGNWGDGLGLLDSANRRILQGAVAWAAGGETAAQPYILPVPEPAPRTVKLRSVD